MCRNCGAIIGAGEQLCAVCGVPVSDTPPQASQPRTVVDRETLRFARAILNRPHKFTIILLILNFFVFLMMWESAGMNWRAFWALPEHVLTAYGAKLNRLINENGQWWRFVTPIFIHVNLPHLLINMYCLWIIGPYVEKLYGSAKFLVIWVVTGIAGVAGSYLTVINSDAQLGSLGRFLFKTQDVPSAGASGALFGLVGVLFVFGIKFRHELPEGFKRAFGTGMVPLILINLFIGYLGRGFIDNAAHLGGLISGAALALVVQYRRPGEQATITVSWYVLQFAVMLLALVSFFKVVQRFNDPVNLVSSRPLPQSANSEKRNDFVAYSAALHQAQETLNQALKGDVRGVDETIKQLDAVVPLDARADELKAELRELLVRAKQQAESESGGGPPEKDSKLLAALLEDVNSWKRQHNDWLKTTGRNY